MLKAENDRLKEDLKLLQLRCVKEVTQSREELVK
jgi:hypothetical protein